jgi:hypothetical protein
MDIDERLPAESAKGGTTTAGAATIAGGDDSGGVAIGGTALD